MLPISPLNIHIERAAKVIACGGIAAYPTEAVWGFGVDPNNTQAIECLLALKRRPWEKGLIIIASEIAHIAPWLECLSVESKRRLMQPTHNPTTWLTPNLGIASAWVTGEHSTVAIRLTRHPVAAALCKAFGGPIISTSANVTGSLPRKHVWRLSRSLHSRLDIIVPGVCGKQVNPSEIRDLITNKIVRAGT